MFCVCYISNDLANILVCAMIVEGESYHSTFVCVQSSNFVHATSSNTIYVPFRWIRNMYVFILVNTQIPPIYLLCFYCSYLHVKCAFLSHYAVPEHRLTFQMMDLLIYSFVLHSILSEHFFSIYWPESTIAFYGRVQKARGCVLVYVA